MLQMLVTSNLVEGSWWLVKAGKEYRLIYFEPGASQASRKHGAATLRRSFRSVIVRAPEKSERMLGQWLKLYTRIERGRCILDLLRLQAIGGTRFTL